MCLGAGSRFSRRDENLSIRSIENTGDPRDWTEGVTEGWKIRRSSSKVGAIAITGHTLSGHMTNWVHENRRDDHEADEQTIELPPGLVQTELLLNLPASVRRYISHVGHEMLTKMRDANVLSDFLGEKTFHLQGNLETSVEGHGRVQIDDVYVTEVTGRICTLVVIRKNERLPRSRVRGQMVAAQMTFGVGPSKIVSVIVQSAQRLLGYCSSTRPDPQGG